MPMPYKSCSMYHFVLQTVSYLKIKHCKKRINMREWHSKANFYRIIITNIIETDNVWISSAKESFKRMEKIWKSRDLK